MTNQTITQRADNFLNQLPCHVFKPFPAPSVTVQNARIADMLLSAYAAGGNSEFSALTQYFTHSMTAGQEDISSLLFCICMDEMHHMELIGRMTLALGGDLRYWNSGHSYWNGGGLSYGTTLPEKLSQDMFAEHEAITAYDSILRVVQSEKNPALAPVEALVNRILEDEHLHLQMLTDKYNSVK